MKEAAKKPGLQNLFKSRSHQSGIPPTFQELADITSESTRIFLKKLPRTNTERTQESDSDTSKGLGKSEI